MQGSRNSEVDDGHMVLVVDTPRDSTQMGNHALELCNRPWDLELHVVNLMSPAVYIFFHYMELEFYINSSSSVVLLQVVKLERGDRTSVRDKRKKGHRDPNIVVSVSSSRSGLPRGCARLFVYTVAKVAGNAIAFAVKKA